MNTEFNNIISLGFFCSVASELEKIGLRSASYPFDWLISGFNGVIEAIESHFQDFMLFENMAQHESYPSFYKDIKYDMQFYHDFDEYHPIIKQLPKVKEKYNRRIERFYNSIKNPTLFLRYIENQDEVDWIENNHNRIDSLLKSYNTENEIIWIANSEIHSKQLKIFHFDKDENDSVARNFLDNDSDLKNFLESLTYSNREKNMDFYNSKQQRKKHKKNYKNKLYKMTHKHYSHSLKYS